MYTSQRFVIQLTPRHIPDLSGGRYGRLAVLGFSRHERVTAATATRQSIWVCRCDCGLLCERSWHSLKLYGQRTIACGKCAKAVGIERRRVTRTKHGLANAPEYRVWSAMKRRCGAVQDKSYANYGGRGITVCERWQSSFSSFIADMGRRPTDNHTIERIDNDGNYEPGNCRWATPSEQNANKRRATSSRGIPYATLTYRGTTRTLQEWADVLGMNIGTLKYRLSRWPIDRAMSVERFGVYVQWQGERLTISQWSKRLGIGRGTLATRLKRGWSVGRALTTR